MIKSFRDKRTQALFVFGAAPGIQPDLARRAKNRLELLERAGSIAELRKPPGNRLHALRGDRDGQHAIAVNRQWRICFSFVDGHVHDVEFCDYH
jgi:proteic killer suppression protein